jgi:hypothetical protein
MVNLTEEQSSKYLRVIGGERRIEDRIVVARATQLGYQPIQLDHIPIPIGASVTTAQRRCCDGLCASARRFGESEWAETL